MLKVAINRGMSAAVLIVIASVFSFIIIAAFPGNVAALIAELRGGFVSHEVVEKVAEEYGLNDPLPVRYLAWVGDVLQGDFGQSLRTGEEVAAALGKRFWLRSCLEAGISWAAMCHLGIALPQLERPGQTLINGMGSDVLVGERWLVRDGGVIPPQRPGLGVELDTEALQRYHQLYLNEGELDYFGAR